MTPQADGCTAQGSGRPGPGWYVVRARVGALQRGRFWAHLTSIGGAIQQVPLGRVEDTATRGVLLALPPELAKVEFAIGDDTRGSRCAAEMVRIGRARALLMLLLGPPQAGERHPIRRIRSNLQGVARPMMAGRLHQAVYGLAAAYQARLQLVGGRVASAPCELRQGMQGSSAAGWYPIHELSCIADGPAPEWEALGDDPQMRLEHNGVPVSLRAGWYRVEVQLAPQGGRLVSPALYPDYGSGFQAYDMVALPEPDEEGRLRALVLFKSHVTALRLDPSVRRARFTILSSALRRVGRARALTAMLGRFRTSAGRRDWVATLNALGTFVADSTRDGVSAAATRLYQGSAGEAGDYVRWTQLYDTFEARDLDLMRSRAASLDPQPLVSILLPVYETPEKWLRQCLDSVLAQAYARWELCIVDDASPSPHVRAVLDEYERRDARIRVKRRDTNGHISAASNDALAMASGEYVALLDHDDILRPHALLEVMERFVARPELGLVYSDEDKIDQRGRRFQPYFKPDWNPDLLLSQNYICHFTVVRAELARQVGGFRTGYEGSQDHDLFLRCTAGLPAGRIAHVPKVLYHWRAIEGSTALERGAKDYASAAGVRAVADYLARAGRDASAEELAHGHYRVRWALPAPAPRVSIIVPTRDRLELLRKCVESVLEKTAYPDFEIIIVDNQSKDPGTLEWLARAEVDPRIRVLRYDAPFNYSAINNWAAARATGDVLCLLNNDIEVMTQGWLEELASQASRPEIGAVGAMLYYPDGSIQHAGVILGLGGVANHVYTGLPAGTPGHGARALVAQNLSAVTGACLAVRKSVYERVGGLEERLEVAFNDIDFCLRLREAGYRNVWTPFAELVHHESASRGREDSDEKISRFLREVRYMEDRWRDWLHNDPAYNPNLTLADVASGLAFPPRLGCEAPRSQ